MVGAPDDLFAVPREDGATVVADSGSDLLLFRAVSSHRPQIQIARGERCVDDAIGLPIDGSFSVVAGRIGELLQNLSCVGGEVDVIARKDAPYVTLAAVGRRGTGLSGFVSRRVDDVLAVTKEI